MNSIMKGILSRLLSQEIANQERWQQDEIKKYGKQQIDRDKIIKNIKDFMRENEIGFSERCYDEVR